MCIRRGAHVAKAGAVPRALRRVTLLAVSVLGATQTHAQPPPPAPPPPPPWTGSAGFGLSLNRGNTATTNFNVSFEATRDPKTDSVWRFKGLYLRGDD